VMSSPLPCNLAPLRPKYLPRHLFSNTHSLCSSRTVRDKASYPYKNSVYWF
jgi:hypothetical protein